MIVDPRPVVLKRLSGDLRVHISARESVEQTPVHRQRVIADIIESAVEPKSIPEDGSAQGKVSFPVCLGFTGEDVPLPDKDPIAALEETGL
jgi:hypothetical protein